MSEAGLVAFSIGLFVAFLLCLVDWWFARRSLGAFEGAALYLFILALYALVSAGLLRWLGY